jgi:hypothetical protein
MERFAVLMQPAKEKKKKKSPRGVERQSSWVVGASLAGLG